MAKEEREEYENILQPTEEPKRAKKAGKGRIAKLTGRTFSSLKAKIDGKKIDGAIKKFNKNVHKYNDAMHGFRSGVLEARNLKAAQENGVDVSDAEMTSSLEVALSYEKKLAKLAVRILDEDIKKAAQVAKPKGLRIPRVVRRFLQEKLPKVYGKLIELEKKREKEGLAKTIAVKKEERKIKSATKDYIKSSLESAVYENPEEKVPRESLDAKVIEGLALEGKNQTFEERMASLRKFISRDGKTSISEEEEIGPKVKPTSNVPPITPDSSVKREEPKVTDTDLFGGLEEKKIEKPAEKEEPKVADTDLFGGIEEKKAEKPAEKEEPKVADADLFGGIEEKKAEKPAEKEEIVSEEKSADVEIDEMKSAREKEKSDIVSLGKAEEVLLRQLEKETSPETKKMIEEYLEKIHEGIIDIVKNSTIVEKKEQVVEEPAKEESIVEPTTEEITETVTEIKEEPESKEFVYFGPNFYEKENVVKEEKVEESTKDEPIVPIEIKEFNVERAMVVGNPAPEKIPLADLDVITQARNKALEMLEKEKAVTAYYTGVKDDLLSIRKEISEEREKQAKTLEDIVELSNGNDTYVSSLGMKK